jgi:glycosyltransferase involved in cell wall biosynthesis
LRLAYFVQPHHGGTYSVFTTLRAGLRRSGVDLVWIGLEAPSSRTAHDVHDDGGFYVFPEGAGPDGPARLVDRLAREDFDGVFINVLADQIQMNIARYLPSRLLRVMIVHNITPATYAAAAALRRHVHATVGVSQRCRDDLVTRHNFPPATTVAIPNAVDLTGFAGTARMPRPAGQTRLLFLGRIDDAAKGVFWLPRILGALPPGQTLTVAGGGPDLPELQARFGKLGARVSFVGPVGAEAVPSLLARHDILVMPSRFEGFGIVCVEAMAAGCVPVVSRITGVTDTIVEEGVTGRLFDMGDWRMAARAILDLGADPTALSAMSARARSAAFDRFGAARMADAYLALLTGLKRSPPQVAPPLPLDRYALPPAFGPGLRAWVPTPLKNWLRTVRERAASA